MGYLYLLCGTLVNLNISYTCTCIFAIVLYVTISIPILSCWFEFTFLCMNVHTNVIIWLRFYINIHDNCYVCIYPEYIIYTYTVISVFFIYSTIVILFTRYLYYLNKNLNQCTVVNWALWDLAGGAILCKPLKNAIFFKKGNMVILFEMQPPVSCK